MNGYELIMKIQRRIQQDPEFAKKFNKVVQDLSNVPGLQQEIMKIAQIQDEKKREKAIERLPSNVKNTVREMLDLINK